jgi:hypothetical protein
LANIARPFVRVTACSLCDREHFLWPNDEIPADTIGIKDDPAQDAPMTLEAEIEAHIAAVEEAYRDLLTGPKARIEGGSRQWTQFQDAVASWRAQQGPERVLGVIERVNELVVAGILVNDPAVLRLEYEPQQVHSKQRIDFRLGLDVGQDGYAEVKTVQPQTGDNDENWKRYEDRRVHLTRNTDYIVSKDWLGARIFGRSFSARAAFLRYTLQFEEKLEAAQVSKPGTGCLIFCGNGMDWHPSELEDFADFYRTGKHRPDDPFAEIEAHHMQENSLVLRGNIHSFGCLIRGHEDIQPKRWIFPVRGPRLP